MPLVFTAEDTLNQNKLTVEAGDFARILLQRLRGKLKPKTILGDVVLQIVFGYAEVVAFKL